MSPTTPFSTLARAMARGTRPSDLLPELHRELLAALGAARSVVLESSTVSNDYIASSGRGFDGVGDLHGSGTARRRSSRDIAAAGPAVVTAFDASLARSAAREPARADYSCQARQAADDPRGRAARGARVGGARSRHARRGGIRHRARVGQARPRRNVPSPHARAVAGVRSRRDLGREPRRRRSRLSRTKRTRCSARDGSRCGCTIAAHASSLFTASSDPQPEKTPRLPAESGEAAARGLRLDRPQLVGHGVDRLLVAPLRGWRRALGTLIVEGGAAGRGRRAPARRRARSRASAGGRDRKRAAAGRNRASAPPARRHVQLARLICCGRPTAI